MERTPLEEPAVETPPHRTPHPLKRVVRTIRAIGNQVAIIRVKWLLAGMLVFVVAVVLTQVQFNDINSAERDKIEAQRVRDKYLADLTNYNDSVRGYNDCLGAVARSDLNRGQWQLVIDGFAANDDPGSQEFAEFLQTGPLMASEPRKIEECVEPGDPPDVPEGLFEEVTDNTSIPPTETTIEPIPPTETTILAENSTTIAATTTTIGAP